jgi:molybdopterin molybdotransferase
MTDLQAARELVLNCVARVGEESVALRDAVGRVLAEDLVAAEDIVPFARSAMDGFAVRAADTIGASRERPIGLAISGSAFAEAGTPAIAPQKTIAISTGAPMPTGADAVIPIENVEHSCSSIRVFAKVNAGDCIFPPAEDAHRGDLLARKGERIRASDVALLAMAGHANVPVFLRPRVSILATGNELVEVGAIPKHGQIRNSNAPALAALAEESGAESLVIAVATDDRTNLRESLDSARRDADLVITTGGASRGQRDLVKSTLAELGAELKFNEVSMRPGRPMGFAIWDGIPICVVPGNPAAVFVCFHLFIAPAIGKLAGASDFLRKRFQATVRGNIHGRPGMDYVVYSRAKMSTAGFEVEALPNQCSALVRTASDANALLFVPKTGGLATGDVAEIEILDWESVAAG